MLRFMKRHKCAYVCACVCACECVWRHQIIFDLLNHLVRQQKEERLKSAREREREGEQEEATLLSNVALHKSCVTVNSFAQAL